MGQGGRGEFPPPGTKIQVPHPIFKEIRTHQEIWVKKRTPHTKQKNPTPPTAKGPLSPHTAETPCTCMFPPHPSWKGKVGSYCF